MNAINDIRHLFDTYGHKHYGEQCTQTQHAISAALHAKQSGEDNALIIAAFLHDIGHFIADNLAISGFDEFGHQDHADIGANWLKERGFPAGVYQPIRYHVMAKRYLSSNTKGHLSSASQYTLAQQGGVLSTKERQHFEVCPFFEQAIQLRYCDDAGKPTGEFDDDITPWLQRINDFLSGNSQQDATLPSHSTVS